MPINQQKQGNIPTTPIRFLVYATRPCKKVAIAAIILVIVAAVLSQSTALFFKWIIEAVEGGDKEKALLFGLLYPLAVFIVQLIIRGNSWLGMTWTIDAKRYTTDVLFSHTLSHSHTYFSNRFAGSLLNKVGNVVGAVDSLIHDFLWSYLSTFVALATTLYFIFSVDIFSGFIFTGLVATILCVNSLRMGKKQQYSHAVAASNTKLRGAIVDVFSNIGAVRQYSGQAHEEQYVERLGGNWHRLSKISWSYSEISQLINGIILFVFASGMFYVLTLRWQSDHISTSEFIFVLTLFSQLTGTLVFLGRAMTMYARVMGEMREGLTDLLIDHEIVDTDNATRLQVKNGRISWKDVDFTFGEALVFSGFNLDIAPGQRVGLVGHSGAGKSTFVSLLLRQHDVTKGAIFIDGQNISEVNQDSLRDAVAVVPQEPLLFHRSIRDNIAYGKLDASDEEIIAVAKKAQAHDFINKLALGYETLVGERGIKLSGGQKQRVAIARAMLKNAPLLILDEATSALDSESEVAIQKALHELMEGKTVVAIAHRLSTLREMDRIIVLEIGKIVEDGTHDTLKSGGGVYQRLWEHQAGGFLQE